MSGNIQTNQTWMCDMAEPTQYDKDYDFSAFQSSKPDEPLPGDRLDTELQNIETALDETQGALRDIRRSDGQLQNDIVTPDSISDATYAVLGLAETPNEDVVTVAENIDAVNDVSVNMAEVTNVSDNMASVITAAQGHIAFYGLSAGNTPAENDTAIAAMAADPQYIYDLLGTAYPVTAVPSAPRFENGGWLVAGTPPTIYPAENTVRMHRAQVSDGTSQYEIGSQGAVSLRGRGTDVSTVAVVHKGLNHYSAGTEPHVFAKGRDEVGYRDEGPIAVPASDTEAVSCFALGCFGNAMFAGVRASGGAAETDKVYYRRVSESRFNQSITFSTTSGSATVSAQLAEGKHWDVRPGDYVIISDTGASINNVIINGLANSGLGYPVVSHDPSTRTITFVATNFDTGSTAGATGSETRTTPEITFSETSWTPILTVETGTDYTLLHGLELFLDGADLVGQSGVHGTGATGCEFLRFTGLFATPALSGTTYTLGGEASETLVEPLALQLSTGAQVVSARTQDSSTIAPQVGYAADGNPSNATLYALAAAFDKSPVAIAADEANDWLYFVLTAERDAGGSDPASVPVYVIQQQLSDFIANGFDGEYWQIGTVHFGSQNDVTSTNGVGVADAVVDDGTLQVFLTTEQQNRAGDEDGRPRVQCWTVAVGSKGIVGGAERAAPVGPVALRAPVGASRAELAQWVQKTYIPKGFMFSDGDNWYVGEPGAQYIPFMPGVRPFGASHPEHFGAVGDGVTDDLPAIQAMLDYGGSAVLGVNRSPGDVPVYRCSTTPVATVPITIRGTRKTDRLQIDNSNTEEGLFIKSSDVRVSNFEIMANAATGIENGTGDKGTCITISEWFTPPDDPEPDLVKNIVIDCMRFTRKTGSKSAHAISILARTSGVLIDGCDFIGASNEADEGYHGDAVLTHWGAHSHGVSTTQLGYDGQTSNFTPGATLTGATSGATAYIVYVDDDGATGTLWLKLVKGEFEDGETLTDNEGGAAVADGDQSVGLRQSRFEPGHYSFHPNNVTIRNCRLRKVGRFIACSASYSIHAENIDYLGPVQGGQLIDLPIGDEGSTFAHPDDAGRVYTDFSFKNITGRMMTGTGANAVTAIDCSGFSTSKQTDADLAAYASAPYTDEPYAGEAQPRRRLFKWGNVVFENITYDAGPADPPSVTPYVRTIYMRNLWGNFTFNNVNAVGRDEVLSLEMVNVVGNYAFNSCDFTGGVVGDATETVSFRSCKIHNTTTEAGTQAVLWAGERNTVNVDGAVAAGSTVVPLASGSPVRILVGQRVYFAGGMVTCAKYVESGDEQIHVTPLPIALTDLQVLTIDQWSRTLTFDCCDVSGGDEGFSVNNTIGATINQGSIRGAGQYGVLANTNSEIYITGTTFANNGLRRLTSPSLTTRDIFVSPDATFIGDKIRFEQSDLVLHNISNSADAEKVSLTNSVFAGDPITAETSLAALANGSPIVFHSNTDAIGASVLFSGEWTPVIEFVDGAAGLTHDFQTGTFTVTDDRVMIEYDVRLTSKGAASGGILVSGLPHAAQNTPPNIGVVALYGASGLETGSCVTRMVSGKLRVYQQGATDLGGLSASNATDTLRLIGQTTYRRA